jgi:hypothetical protein
MKNSFLVQNLTLFFILIPMPPLALKIPGQTILVGESMSATPRAKMATVV